MLCVVLAFGACLKMHPRHNFGRSSRSRRSGSFRTTQHTLDFLKKVRQPAHSEFMLNCTFEWVIPWCDFLCTRCMLSKLFSFSQMPSLGSSCQAREAYLGQVEEFVYRLAASDTFRLQAFLKNARSFASKKSDVSSRNGYMY